MKKKIFIFCTAGILGCSIFAMSLNAKPTGKSVTVCFTNQDGQVVSVGNTCSDGEKDCISNPCPN